MRAREVKAKLLAEREKLEAEKCDIMKRLAVIATFEAMLDAPPAKPRKPRVPKAPPQRPPTQTEKDELAT